MLFGGWWIAQAISCYAIFDMLKCWTKQYFFIQVGQSNIKFVTMPFVLYNGLHDVKVGLREARNFSNSK